MELMSHKRATTALKDDPEHDTVHQPYAAFNQGFDAFLLRIPKCKNLYRFAEYSRWWTMGWEEAQEQDLEEAGVKGK